MTISTRTTTRLLWALGGLSWCSACGSIVDSPSSETNAASLDTGLDTGPDTGPDTGTDDGPSGCGQDGTPAPGTPGGLCVNGTCDGGVTCDPVQSVCVSAADPCQGFSCGGSARGCCEPVTNAPSCVCNAGFDNLRYPLYCCPQDGSDPICL